MPLIVTGTIGIDTVETPTGQAAEVLGGSCTYFAAAASFFGPVRIVAAAGSDLPDRHRETLLSFKGIDARGLEIRSGSKTFRWGGKYASNMDQRETLFTELGVLAENPPEVPVEFRDSEFVFLANTHPSVQLGMLEQLPARRLAVADTMDLWINTARPELERLLSRIDGLVLNYDEAEQFTGKRNPVTAARKILELGPRFVVVKKGEHGALLIHRDGLAAVPAYPSEEVVDPTGAGDSFAGGLMGSLANDRDRGDPGSFEQVRRGIVQGTVIASFVIERFSLDGLREATPERIRDRLEAFRRMLRAD